MKNKDTIIRLCVWATMTAIVFFGNMLRIKFAVPLGGVTSLTFANVFCALAGILLGPWGGFFAAGFGSGLYDLTDPAYVADVPFTIVTKGIYGLVAGLIIYRLFRSDKEKYVPQLAATVCAAAAYAVAYLVKNYFYNARFLHNLTEPAECWAYIVAKVPATVTNGVIAVIFAPILGVAIWKALHKNNLDRLFPE